MLPPAQNTKTEVFYDLTELFLYDNVLSLANHLGRKLGC